MVDYCTSKRIKGFTALYPNNFKGQLRIPTEIQDILTEFNSINGV